MCLFRLRTFVSLQSKCGYELIIGCRSRKIEEGKKVEPCNIGLKYIVNSPLSPHGPLAVPYKVNKKPHP